MLLPPLVLTPFQFYFFLSNLVLFFSKAWTSERHPNLRNFFTPPNSQTITTTKHTTLANKHSRSRGVAQIIFDAPMLHGNRFVFRFPCSVGTRFLTFATCLQRERCFFFSFSARVPSEKVKNTENRIMESCCGRVGAKDAKCKSPHKSILPTIGTHLYISNNSIIQFIIVNMSPRISTIRRLTRICFQMNN